MASLGDFFYDNIVYSNSFREWELRVCTIRSEDCPDELRLKAIEESIATGMEVKESAQTLIEDGKEWINDLSEEEHRDDELLELIAGVIDRLEYDVDVITSYNERYTAFRLKLNLKAKPRRPKIILPVVEYEEDAIADAFEDEESEEEESEEETEESDEESKEESAEDSVGEKTEEEPIEEDSDEDASEDEESDDPATEESEDPEKESASVPEEEKTEDPEKEKEDA